MGICIQRWGMERPFGDRILIINIKKSKRKMKALVLLKKSKSVDERAAQFVQVAKEDLYDDLIKPLKRKISDIDNSIFELTDFTLETNLNKGMRRMSSDDIKAQFTKVIELRYQKDLLEAELTSKEATFNYYFGLEEEEVADGQA
jgi:D-Tyr-tRNAtyr deacylase